MTSSQSHLDEVMEVWATASQHCKFDKTVLLRTIIVVTFLCIISRWNTKVLPRDVHSDFPNIGEQEFQK